MSLQRIPDSLPPPLESFHEQSSDTHQSPSSNQTAPLQTNSPSSTERQGAPSHRSFFRRCLMERTQPYPPPTLQEPPSPEILRQERLKNEIENNLFDWLIDSNIFGNKLEAKKLILSAYSKNSSVLRINNLNLHALPSSLGYLHKLQVLDLSTNQLSLIPFSLGNLSRLTILSIGNNRLKSAQSFIGNLFHLRIFNLSHNHITSITPSIGNCQRLQLLSLCDNPNLTELPLSLGDIEGLTLILDKTSIPPEMASAILDRCKKIQDPNVFDSLSERISFWSIYAKHYENRTYQLDFLFNLPPKKKQSINEWLQRLAHISDFQGKQTFLAHLACSILETLENNPQFENLFFSQISVNLCNCQDRSAMALNEIYSSWRLYTADPNAPIYEKLQLLTGIAKTEELRKFLSTQLNKIDFKESVEVYLFYESFFRERLGLISVIHRMAFPRVGYFPEIDPHLLIETVNNNFKKTLIHYPLFKNLSSQDPEYVQKKSQIKEDYRTNCEGTDPASLSEGNYLLQLKAYKQEKKEKLSGLAISWFEDHLKPSKL